MVPQQVSFVERSFLSQRVPYHHRRFHVILTFYYLLTANTYGAVGTKRLRMEKTVIIEKSQMRLVIPMGSLYRESECGDGMV